MRRRAVLAALDGDPDFTVVGEGRSGREAVALVARLRPSAVLLDLDLPGTSGLAAIEQIMASNPTPILVCSATEGGADSGHALEALAAGAVDVLTRPPAGDAPALELHLLAVRRELRVCARVRVITHPRGRLRQAVLAGTALPGGDPAPQEPPACDRPDTGVRLVVVGASTGGPQALLTVLSALPGDLEQAVLVVQHMADGFVPGLATWLDGLVPATVVVGASGRRLVPGTITIAPSGGNLLVQDDRLRVLVTPPAPGQFHVPGVDATFHSVAEALGPEAVGVLLTGMGRDGALGLKAMQSRGAATIGQDEATSAVYGMPAAAYALGAVDDQLPVDRIAAALLALLGRSS